ncbi:hypothetical protein [Lysobacter sp. CA199]|uniref:hypothetical protein n=1 Tax=Lysobacter sp. CA199 TaxID=3455608 RepID=UPI003F8D5B92
MLELPATPSEALREAVIPGLALLPAKLDSPAARLLVLGICMQESNLTDRAQVLNGGGKGPARGLPQFERGTEASKGGVWGIYLHPASRELLRGVCAARKVPFHPNAIWKAIEVDDLLAVACARLLLLTDAEPLPAVGDLDGAFVYYLRTWRPGAARTPEGKAKCLVRWRTHYPRALAAVSA